MCIRLAAVNKHLNETGQEPSGQPYPLYEAHRKIYPQGVRGRFRSLKWRIAFALLFVFFLTPWLRWNRGPEAPGQAILLDIDGRRVYILGLEIWPQEIYYLALLLVFGAVLLFMATALLGRVWCGFVCPQTAWTDLFMLAGRLIEGDRNRRMKLANAPLSLEKIVKKTFKHAIWLIISLLTAIAFVLYFNDLSATPGKILTGQGGQWVNVFIVLLTTITYVFAGFLREQVCIYMCPWLRFQVAMFDEHSLIVTYERWRGEPRGNARIGQSFAGRGHCIDCGKCVLVCPTGIDIRNGQQVACIGCAICIDACDTVMDKFSLPRELIAYDSEANQAARANGLAAKTRMLRPRTIAYGAILVFIAAFLGYALTFRDTVEINVQADRSPLFVTLSDGQIRCGYAFKVINKKPRPRAFVLSLKGVKGATMRIAGFGDEDKAAFEISVGPDRVGAFHIFVKAHPNDLSGPAAAIIFTLRDKESGEVFEHKAMLRGPGVTARK